MDGRRFDDLARSLVGFRSRRALLRAAVTGVAGGLGLATGRRPDSTTAAANLIGEACSSTSDCSGLQGVVCCGADEATGKKGACRDTQLDVGHCGGCGNVCPSGKTCLPDALGAGRCCAKENGACTRESDCCGSNFNLSCCDDVCVFIEDASANCGVCGRVCKPGEACCNYECVNLGRNDDHCGTCGYRCPPEKSTCCGRTGTGSTGLCVDEQTDRKHCGSNCRACSDVPYEVCEDGKCVRAKRAEVPGNALPNLGYAVLAPPDLDDRLQLHSGRMIYASANLVNVGISPAQAAALEPGFQVAYAVSYAVPGLEAASIEELVSLTRVLFGSDADALAAVEAMFFSHAGYIADLTANFPQGDKGYSLLWEGPVPLRPDLVGVTLETGIFTGRLLNIVSTSRIGGQPDEGLHRDVTTGEAEFARQVATDGFAAIDPDRSGLGPFMLQLDGVPEANFFPSRIDGEDVRTFGESDVSRENVAVAHGDSERVWLNNFVLPDAQYRVFNRVWEFSSKERAFLFGEQMPEPLMPTYDRVGIELLNGTSPLMVDGQVAYDFTWPQSDGAWFGYQILFPLGRYYFSLSVADVGLPSDVPITDRVGTAKESAEELARRYIDELARIISDGAPPFTLLPKIDPTSVIRGQEPETDDQKRADASSVWSYEQGTEVEANLQIYRQTIDRGEKPDDLTCNQAFVIRSVWEDKTVRSCDGYGGPKDDQNDVCKEAAKNAAKMAATIPCPKAECPKREESEIWRGWRCFEDEPGPGDHHATCAVELKIVCRPDVQP